MPLELQVLGPLRVLVDGRPVEPGPTRRRTLLAALAFEPGAIVPIDTLADRVWDGEPPASADATIHAYVSRLRSGLRTFAPDGAEQPGLLVTHSPGYRFDLPASSVDSHRFVLETQQARRLMEAGELAAASRLGREALSLWRGEAYADIPAQFARREAARLGDLRVTALELTIQADLGLGRHESLLAELTGLVADHPLREGLHGALMLALYRSGRQAEALQHFGVVRALLADELGVDPGPELRRLHEQILRQDGSLEPATLVAPVPVARVVPDPEVTRGSAPITGSRLVGRGLELGRLGAVLDPVTEVATVAVVGEAGIGKTRLVEELADRAAADGVAIAWGRCWRHEGAPVLWPWVQALHSVAEQYRPEHLRAALMDRGSRVATLLPELAPLVDDGGRASAPDQIQVRLYDAVAAFLGRLAEIRPVLVLLEDMHWADPASAELVEYLQMAVTSPRAALVLTVRAEQEHGAEGGTALLSALARSRSALRLDLVGLSADAVGEYVAERTGSALDDATSAALADRTGGNPFFVGELVRLLVTDVDDVAPALPDAVPDSIREVVARRLDRLPADDQVVLRVAAVVGRTFELDLLEAACGFDADQVDEAVDRATALGILGSEPGQLHQHRFVHALTQQTLLDTTGPARLRRVHARVAAAMERRDEGQLLDPVGVERLTFHLARTGGLAELERAASLSVRAARLALDQGNHPEAEALLRQALDLGSRIAERGLETHDEVAAQADQLSLRGDPERAVAVLRDLLERLPDTAGLARRARVLASLADALLRIDAEEDPLPFSAEALALTPSDEPSRRARALLDHARTLAGRFRFDDARPLAEEGLALAESEGLDDLAADAMTTLGSLPVGGSSDARHRTLQAAIDRACRTGAVHAELRGRYTLARSHEDAADYDEAERWFASAVELASSAGIPWSQDGFDSRWQLAWIHYVRGEWDEVLRLTEVTDLLAPPVARATLDVLRLTVEHAQGHDVDDAVAALRPMWERDGMVALHAAALEMAVASERQDPERVLQTYDDAVTTLSRLWREWFSGRVRLAAIALGALADTLPPGSSGRSLDGIDWVARADRLAADGHRVIEDATPSSGPWGAESRSWLALMDAERLRLAWVLDGAPRRSAQVTPLLDMWRAAERAFAELGHVHQLAAVRRTLARLEADPH